MRPITPFDDFTIPEPNSGCVIWIGGAIDNRYGAYWDGEQQHRAHVFALERKLDRKLEKGEFSCHTCDVTFCVNEDHLYVGNAQSNMDDKMKRGRYKGGRPSDLSTGSVAAILAMEGSQQRIADLFGISQAQVSRIKRGLRSGRTRK